MSNKTPTRPPSFLCQDIPGDTLHYVKCLLLVLQTSDAGESAGDDEVMGRHVATQLCCDALEYEASRITDWKGKGDAV